MWMEVGKQPLDTYMTKVFNKHKDHPSVAKFPVETSIKAATSAYEALKITPKEIDDLGHPFGFRCASEAHLRYCAGVLHTC